MPTLPPLPPTRHVPASGSAPDHAFFAAIKAQCPPRVSDANWREVPPYLYGFDLYAAGYFWEAHEVWEPVWMACAPNSRERQLMAGLIQLANACLKLEMGRLRAARRLLGEALRHVAEAAQKAAGTPLMGLDVEALQLDLGAYEAGAGLAAPLDAQALVGQRSPLQPKL
jgi:uncharacterized protein